MKLAIESPRVGHEAESVTNIIVDVFGATPYRRGDDDFTFLHK